MALLFMGCVQDKSSNQGEAEIDFSQYLKIQSAENFQEVVALQGIYGVELIVKGCSESDLTILEGFQITEKKEDRLILSLGFGQLIQPDTIILKLPKEADVTVSNVIYDLSPKQEWASKNGDIPVLLGDFNHDGYVDLTDFMLFRNKYRLETGNNGYTTEYDIYPAVKTFTKPEWADVFSENTPDGVINLYDFIYFTFNYRKSVNRPPILEWVKPNDVNTTGEAIISWSAVDYDKNDIEFQIKIFEEDALGKTVQLTNSTETTFTFVEGNSYRFELTATDVVNANATAESTEIIKLFVVNYAPTITKITENIQNIYASSTVFEWEGNDEDGTIDHYKYKIDDGSWITITESQIELSDYDEGEHTIFVKAFDNDGAYSETISWTFEYIAQVLMLDYLSGKVYVKAYGLKNVKGIMFEMNYDSDKVMMDTASTEDEGADGELFYNDTSNGTYTIDIGFWNTKDTIDGTVASIEVVNAVGSSSVTFNDATIVNLIGENEIENNEIECIGVFIETKNPLEMIEVKAGSFLMGDTRNEGLSSEKPVHEVELTYDYYIGKYEVTNEQFIEFLNDCENITLENPKYPKINGMNIFYSNNYIEYSNGMYQLVDETYRKLPVTDLYFYGAAEYCDWLNAKHGFEEAYGEYYGLKDDITNTGFRLPTEAEWEYAARGGHVDIIDGIEQNDYKYAGSNQVDEVAWYHENSGGKLHEVGSKNPNELGIYDMSGNVAEWCHDYYIDFYDDKRINPFYNTHTNKLGSLRGGEYNYGSVRLTYRDTRLGKKGFRIARTKNPGTYNAVPRIFSILSNNRSYFSIYVFRYVKDLGETNLNQIDFKCSVSDVDGEIDYYMYKKNESEWEISYDRTYFWEDYSLGEHKFSVKAVDDTGQESGPLSFVFNYVNDLHQSFENNFVHNDRWKRFGSFIPFIQSDYKYSGWKALQFGRIEDEATSALSIDISLENKTPISFYRKVEGEDARSTLYFYVDDEIYGIWSGDNKWGKVVREIPAGRHTLKWFYEKKFCTNINYSAWIDEIKMDNSIELGNEIIFSDENFKSVVLKNIGKSEITEKVYTNEVKDIKELYFGLNSGVQSIVGIEHIENLEKANLEQNNISDLTPLSNLLNIEYLRLANNSIVNTKPLSGLIKLKYLTLQNNNIIDIQSFENLTNLTLLLLESNNISNINVLSNLVQLSTLKIGDNNIDNIDPLSNLTNLVVLTLDNNNISDLTPLEELSALNLLELKYNEITDIQSLVDNSGIGDGDLIGLKYNLLDTTLNSEDYVNLQTIINRGAELYYLPQK